MKYYTFCFLVFLFLQGCAQLTSIEPEADPLAMLDQYMIDKDFGQALHLIAETSAEHPRAVELEGRREMIVDSLRSYEKETISLALKQERAGEWSAARLRYKEALKKSGYSQKLEEAERVMLLRFQERKETLELEELIATGVCLQKKLPLLQKLHDTDPGDPAIQQRYSLAQNDTKEVAQRLLRHGETMLEEKNLAMARRIIPLVVKLVPGPESEAALARLQTQLKAKTYKKRKDKKNTARKKDRKDTEDFNKAMDHGNLSEARHILSRLTPDMRKGLAAELMQERLDRDIEVYVQEELAAGDSFYRAGRYEQAIKVWQAIQELEPDNETVKSKIERAKVIVEKVNSLRKRQAGGATIPRTRE